MSRIITDDVAGTGTGPGRTALKKFVIATVCGLVLALPFVGTWVRRAAKDRCALDGAPLVACYRVRIEDRTGAILDFCCLPCAEMWLKRQTLPIRTILVTDEATSMAFDAKEAYFVRSQVVTTPTTGNRVHVFRDRQDAEQHAQTCKGTILTGDERPFTRQTH